MATQTCRRCGGRFARRDDACSWCGFPAEPRGTGVLLRTVIILGVAAAVCCATGAAALGLALYAEAQTSPDAHRLSASPDAPGPTVVGQHTASAPASAPSPAPRTPTVRPPADGSGKQNRGVETVEVPHAPMPATMQTQTKGKGPTLLAPWDTQNLTVPDPGQ